MIYDNIKQGFIPSLKNTSLKKPQEESDWPPSYFWVNPIYGKALNLKLNNLKFTFISFYPMFVLLLVYISYQFDGGIYISVTRIMLLIEKSGNIFKSFTRTPTWNDAG